LIAGANGEMYINRSGNAGRMSGGAGDVLIGVVRSFLAQHVPPLKTAVAGVYIHGLAGDFSQIEVVGKTGRNSGPIVGLIATDIINHLSAAIARCQES